MNKLIILLPLLLAFNLSSNAQEFLVSALKGNTLYMATGNPCKVVVQSTPCSDVRLVAENATIEKLDEPCIYNILPEELGLVNVKIFSRKTGLLIGEQSFRTDYSTSIEAGVARFEGEIKKEVLVSESGISVSFWRGHMPYDGVLTEYTMIVLRNDEIKYCKKHNDGPYFNDDAKAVIKSLEYGDKLIFVDMKYRYNDGKLYTLRPLELKIIE